jgi:hypothetical protein
MQERTTEEPNQRKAKAVPMPSYAFDGVGQALRLSFPPHAPADNPPEIAALLANLSNPT